MPSSMNAAAISSAHPMPSCTARRESEATTPAPSHPPATHDDDQRRHLPGIDADDADEEQRLRHHRQRVADDERARDQLVGHEAEEPKDRGRGRERADAERVEEIGDEPDRVARAIVGAEPLRTARRRAASPSSSGSTSSRPLATSAPSSIATRRHAGTL